MNAEGPLLDGLTRRLAETPSIFLAEPIIRNRGKVELAAVVTDLLAAIGRELITPRHANRFRPAKVAGRNQARIVSICCWLLYDDWFHNRRSLVEPIKELLGEGLSELAAIIDAERFVIDPERREELVRLVLDRLRLRPSGETVHQAADRLKSLDSVERARLIRETRAREEAERARKLRKEMEATRAREAAAKANREW